jgi:hypothetical protein
MTRKYQMGELQRLENERKNASKKMTYEQMEKWFIDNTEKPSMQYSYLRYGNEVGIDGKGPNKKNEVLTLPKYSNTYYNGTIYSEYWRTGGVGGGSCWDEGDSHHYALDGDEPIKDWCLDKFLEENYPDVTYLKYKKIQEHIGYAEWTEYEYYGNSTNYARYKLDLKKLYEILEG